MWESRIIRDWNLEIGDLNLYKGSLATPLVESISNRVTASLSAMRLLSCAKGPL